MYVSEQSKTQIDDCGRGLAGWENHTIENFFEAAGSWTHAADFSSTQGLADASPLKKMAVFFYCGKIYE